MSSRFPIGSVVRPLNETGEGVVAAYRADGCVLVSMQDGFEIPYLPNQLVLISAPQNASADAEVKAVRSIAASDSPEALYLAFQADGMQGTEIRVSMQLMNTSPNDLLVQVYGLEGKISKSLFAQRLEARKTATVMRATVADLLQFDRFFVQLLPVLRETPAIQGSWEGMVKHQTPAFVDPAGWPLEMNLSGRALLFQVYPELQAQRMVIPKPGPNPSTAKAAATIQAKDWLISERDNFHEVDLHIEELMDDTRGMDNAAMIKYQLQVFQRCLDEARLRRLWKFTVIHGIGKGVLKAEVHKLIRDEGLQFQDASYARYGFGATEVLMR